MPKIRVFLATWRSKARAISLPLESASSASTAQLLREFLNFSVGVQARPGGRTDSWREQDDVMPF